MLGSRSRRGRCQTVIGYPAWDRYTECVAMRKTHLGVCSLLVLVSVTGGWLRADSRTFDFEDPKGVNAIHFLLDSPLEPIMGLAAGIRGKIAFDPAAPEKMSGELRVSADSLHVENARMKEVLHSEDWMHVERYPAIVLVIKEVKLAKKVEADSYELEVVGDFTCRGVTREIPLSIKASYLPDRLRARQGRGDGDLLVLRTEFTIKRHDYKIKPELDGAKVAKEIQLRAAIVGTYERK